MIITNKSASVWPSLVKWAAQVIRLRDYGKSDFETMVVDLRVSGGIAQFLLDGRRSSSYACERTDCKPIPRIFLVRPDVIVVNNINLSGVT